MEIEISQKQLLQAVTSMAAVAGKTKSIQILDNIEVSVNAVGITLRAVNSEATLTRTIECATDGHGCFLINCAQLLKYISTLPDCRLVIKVGDKDIVIMRDKGSGRIAITSPEMFPTPEELKDTIDFTLPAECLMTIVRDGSRFIGDTDLRPHLRHIYIKMADGKMTGYATDTHVLYLNTFDVDAKEAVEFYLNSNAYPIILKMMNAGDICKLSVGKNAVKISCNDQVLCFAVPNSKYPDVERILPKQMHYVMNTVTKDMRDCITRVMAMADGKTKLVKMFVSTQDTVVQCSNYDDLSSAKESFACDCNGAITIGLDGNYVVRALASAGDKVSIGLNDKTHPILFTTENEPDMKIMLMPMTINDDEPN